MFCPNCGIEIEEQARFCVGCGARLAPEDAAVRPTDSGTSRKRATRGTGFVEVTAIPEYELELRPQRISGRRKADTHLLVRNTGNVAAMLQLEAREPEEKCVFSFGPIAPLSPGDEAEIPLAVRTKQYLWWFGDEKTYRFQIEAAAAGGGPPSSGKTINGEFVHRPWFGSRVLGLAGLMMVAVAALLVWLLFMDGGDQKELRVLTFDNPITGTFELDSGETRAFPFTVEKAGDLTVEPRWEVTGNGLGVRVEVVDADTEFVNLLVSYGMYTKILNGELTDPAGSFSSPVDGFLAGHEMQAVFTNNTPDSTEGRFTMSYEPVGDLVASNDAYDAESGQALAKGSPGVLENDTYPERAGLILEVVQNVSDGQLTLANDGSFDYLPDHGFVGRDTFKYKIKAGALESGEATVTIVVKSDRPSEADDPGGETDGPQTETPKPVVANPDSVELNEDTSVSGNVLDNDEGANISASPETQPGHAQDFSLNPDGSFKYTPEPDYNGADSFSYLATDGRTSSKATVTITINPVNDPPVVEDDYYCINWKAGETLFEVIVDWQSPEGRGVLANDTDVEGGLSAELVPGPGLPGELELLGDGSLSYKYSGPVFNLQDPVVFTYSVVDGEHRVEGKITLEMSTLPCPIILIPVPVQ
ncbi:MAG TPA: Ig-like domain-containing protein [Dehalococcoidia bacterium]|nr:Ig-like domain-containing protein [Dehalococcoidia bacterium]